MSRVTLGDNKIAPNVRSVTSIIEDEQLLFTFGDFHLKPINIDGEFNNFF